MRWCWLLRYGGFSCCGLIRMDDEELTTATMRSEQRAEYVVQQPAQRDGTTKLRQTKTVGQAARLHQPPFHHLP